jgi:hypothetical protein
MPVSYWRSRYFRVYMIVALVYWAASVLAVLIIFAIAAMINLANMDYAPFINVTGPFTCGNLIFVAPMFNIICIIFGYVGHCNRMSQTGQKTDESKAETELNVWASIVELQKPDASVRLSAVRKLRCYNTPAVEEALTKTMLDDPDVGIRFEAYLALKFVGKQKAGLLEEQLKAEHDITQKLMLLDLLRKTGEKSQVSPLTFLYSVESDKQVKLSILESLGKFDGYDIKDMAIYILRKEDDKDIKLKALGILSWYGDNDARDVLKHLQNDPDADVRREAGKLLVSGR